MQIFRQLFLLHNENVFENTFIVATCKNDPTKRFGIARASNIICAFADP